MVNNQQQQKYNVDKCEYWVLNSLVFHRLPIAFLGSKDAVELLLNETWGEFDQEDIAIAVFSLANQGYIEFSGNHGEEPVKTLTFSEILSQIGTVRFERREKRMQAVYEKKNQVGLTLLGGDCWEKIARPQWNDFVYWESDGSVSSRSCASKIILQESLAITGLFGEKIHGDSISWERLKNWNATYWKIIENCWKVNYQFTPVPIFEPERFLSIPQGLEKKITEWYLPYEVAAKPLR